MAPANTSPASIPPEGRTFRLTCTEPFARCALSLLEEQGYVFEQETFFSQAYRVHHEPAPLGNSLAALLGLIYIQDKASMLPPLALLPVTDTFRQTAQTPQGLILDMCASPGGKTGLLALLASSATKNTGYKARRKTQDTACILANEPNYGRLDTLRRTLHRQSLVHTATCTHPGQDIPLQENTLSAVLVDPPCSGWGTAKKHPGIMALWHEEKITRLLHLQRILLHHAAQLLVPGGCLVYSTCTTNTAENDEQVAWACDELGLLLDTLDTPAGFVCDDPARTDLEGTLRINGSKSHSQGFYIARLRKPATEQCARGSADNTAPPTGNRRIAPHKHFSRRKQHKKYGLEAGRPLAPREEQACEAAQLNTTALPPGTVYRFGDKVFFLHSQALQTVTSSLRWQGFFLGHFASDTFHPAPAIRPLLPEDSPVLEVDNAKNLKHLLAGQSLPVHTKHKQVLLHYQGTPLARLAVKGTRALWQARSSPGR